MGEAKEKKANGRGWLCHFCMCETGQERVAHEGTSVTHMAHRKERRTAFRDLDCNDSWVKQLGAVLD